VTRCNSVESGIWADPDGTVLWGDCSGRTRRYDGATGIVTTILGGTSVHDGEVATSAFLNGVESMDVAPDGHIYLADRWNQRVRAIDPHTGIIRAAEAYLDNPGHVSVDSRGRAIISHCRLSRVRRVDEDGIIRTIVGTGQNWDKGDGGPAISACLVQPTALTHGPRGDIYVADAIGRIRKVDASSGVITTVAGIGLAGYTGDGGAATEARIGPASAIVVDSEGSVIFSDPVFHVIRRIDPRGVITTIAGRGEAGFSPDGTAAVEAHINSPKSVSLSHDGVVYFSDSMNNRVRRINAEGRFETVAGSGEQGVAADEIQATSAALNEPHGICFFDSHILLISDFYNNKVKAVKLA
jgi:serine/threonine-protein kinase